MIKTKQTRSTNVNVVDETALAHVVGGCGQRGGYRSGGHDGWKKRRENFHGRYEGKGYGSDNYESDSGYDDSEERKYS